MPGVGIDFSNVFPKNGNLVVLNRQFKNKYFWKRKILQNGKNERTKSFILLKATSFGRQI